MKIKSIIAIAVLATASISANAQVKFGLKAGVNFQNLNGKDISGAALANHVVVRYHAGFTLDIPVAEDFYVQSGLLFKTKGAKIDQTKVNLSYIELPITFMYKPKLGEGHLILGFGPYLAYGVGGKYSNDGNDYKVKFQISADKDSKDYFIKPFDAGADFIFGYEFSNRLSMQFNAQLGLINLAPKRDYFGEDKSVVKNTGFGISLGYLFNK